MLRIARIGSVFCRWGAIRVASARSADPGVRHEDVGRNRSRDLRRDQSLPAGVLGAVRRPVLEGLVLQTGVDSRRQESGWPHRQVDEHSRRSMTMTTNIPAALQRNWERMRVFKARCSISERARDLERTPAVRPSADDAVEIAVAVTNIDMAGAPPCLIARVTFMRPFKDQRAWFGFHPKQAR